MCVCVCGALNVCLCIVFRATVHTACSLLRMVKSGLPCDSRSVHTSFTLIIMFCVTAMTLVLVLAVLETFSLLSVLIKSLFIPPML